jgi:putative monooxygenase
VPQPLRPDQGLMIPIGMRHRFRNVGTTEARLVFHLGPLAPSPELGHVDTEQTEPADAADIANTAKAANTGHAAKAADMTKAADMAKAADRLEPPEPAGAVR